MKNSHITQSIQYMHACVSVCELTLLGSVLVIPDKVCDDSDVFSGGSVGDVEPKFLEKLTKIEVTLRMIKQTKTDRQLKTMGVI